MLKSTSVNCPSLWFLIVCFCLCFSVHGQRSVESLSLNGADSNLGGPWSVFGNPAGLTDTHVLSVGADYSNDYLLKELSAVKILLLVPLQAGSFAAAASYFGHAQYWVAQIKGAYAMRFSEALSGGVALKYHQISIGAGYIQKGFAQVDAGMRYRLSASLCFSAQVSNLGAIRSVSLPEDGLERLSMGVKRVFSNVLDGHLVIEKTQGRQVQLRLGLAYRLSSEFGFNTGYDSYSRTLSGGVYWTMGDLSCWMALRHTPLLGYQPALSFTYGGL